MAKEICKYLKARKICSWAKQIINFYARGNEKFRRKILRWSRHFVYGEKETEKVRSLAIVTWRRRTIKIHFWAHNEWKSARFGAWFLRISFFTASQLLSHKKTAGSRETSLFTHLFGGEETTKGTEMKLLSFYVMKRSIDASGTEASSKVHLLWKYV